MRRSILVFAVAFLSFVPGCTERQEASFRMSWPLHDDGAAADVMRFQVYVFSQHTACEEMETWRSASCSTETLGCPEGVRLPSDGELKPLTEAATDRLQDETWSNVTVSLPGDGPWDVLVVGADAMGNGLVYGCERVVARDSLDVELWRPWCDPGACAPLDIHSACDARPTCLPIPGDNAQVDCYPLEPVVFVWEEVRDSDVVACPRTAENNMLFFPCYPARVECREGSGARLESSYYRNGQCPTNDTGIEEVCGEPPGAPNDCDGFCTFEGTCDPLSGETRFCPALPMTGVMCLPTTTCGDDGQWDVCTPAVGVTESCTGFSERADDDCDGISDGLDPDSLAACNTDSTKPHADYCGKLEEDGPYVCVCGENEACTGRQTCCDGECVDINAESAEHCGACFKRCDSPGLRCVAGRCVQMLDGGFQG